LSTKKFIGPRDSVLDCAQSSGAFGSHHTTCPRILIGIPRASRLACLTFVVWLASLSLSHSAPHALLQPIPLRDVHWTEGFWAARFDLCRTQMVPSMQTLMEGTNHSQFLQNFRIAAGLAEGRRRGPPFNDGDFYKFLEGAAATLAVTNDPALSSYINDAIDVIGKAQRADGYLQTSVLIAEHNSQAKNPATQSESREAGLSPFHDPVQFEFYNLGHLFTAASVHHRVTGQTNLLVIARKAADFLYATFHSSTEPRTAICPSHYMGLLDLYEETTDPRYLELAKTLFSLRDLVNSGTDDNQDRIPFAQQTNAMGHAVRANYLYAGAASLFMETAERSYWSPLERIWTNVVEQKMYITGGCGALFDGASPDGAKDQKSITRVHQAYGRNYQLPNLTGHNETCANIANVLWNWRMFLATGEARFMDIVELALYNSVLSGVSLDGTNFCYVNPLRALDPPPAELRWPHKRVPYLSSFCCPPNLVRTIAESAGFAYSKSQTGGVVFVNLYGGSELNIPLNHRRLKLRQETEFPWSGRVRIIVQESPGSFELRLRIPAWTTNTSVRINDVNQSIETSLGYCSISRTWQPGDSLDLDLPMLPQLIEANPFVEEALGQVAIKRGPLVFCLESTDLPRSVRLQNVSIAPDADLVARFDRRLLGGVTLIDTTGIERHASDWNAQLYRPLASTVRKPIKLQFIPYFAWGNRGDSEMSVWLPLGFK
jgi:DUF1680 family protein